MYGNRQTFGTACYFCKSILMNPDQEKVLAKIAERLNSEGITWGIGASMLLSQYGLVDSPADIDIMVATDDIDATDRLLSSLGSKKEKEKSDLYLTDFFYEYLIDSVETDVMAGFKIKLQESVFKYKFTQESVPHFFEISGIKVPFMTLEEWYVLYQLMPNREYKVNLLEEYFNNHGVRYSYLLECFIHNESLPENVKKRITDLIKTKAA